MLEVVATIAAAAALLWSGGEGLSSDGDEGDRIHGEHEEMRAGWGSFCGGGRQTTCIRAWSVCVGGSGMCLVFPCLGRTELTVFGQPESQDANSTVMLPERRTIEEAARSRSMSRPESFVRDEHMRFLPPADAFRSVLPVPG